MVIDHHGLCRIKQPLKLKARAFRLLELTRCTDCRQNNLLSLYPESIFYVNQSFYGVHYEG
jgi:hypothetical protein